MLTRKSLRYPILGSVGFLAAALPGLADFPSEVLNDGPLAYYRLNENVTTPPHDYATNSGSLGLAGYGQYVSGALHPVAGAIVSQPADGAASFPNAAVNRMRVPYNAALNVSGPYSFEFWAKPAALSSADSTTMCPAAFTQFGTPPGNGDGSRFGWLFYQNGAANWTFRTYGTGNTAYSATGGSAPVVGTWYHIAGVWDGANARLYVNGQQVATVAAPAFAPVVDTIIPLSLGSRADGQLGAFRYNGDIDEAAYYNTALSAARIQAHYDAGTNVSPSTPYHQVVLADSPVGYWRLNEPAWSSAGNPVAVNSGSLAATADAKYYGGVVNSAGPRSPAFPGFEANNSSGQFDGGSGYVGSPLSLLNNRAKYTVMGWLKRGAVHSVRGGYFGQNDLLEFGDADNGVNVEAWVDAIGNNLKQAWPWADDQWGFICLTGDGQTNVLYMDGQAVQGRPSNVLNYGNNTWKFNIGGGGIFNTGGDFFNGNVDEVAMFDKALSPGRILTLYCIASGAAYAPIIYSEPPVASPSNTVYATTTFSLIPDIGGSQPMTFQWQKDGVNIPGATTSTYVKANCTAADAGSYTVVASNAHGTVTNLVPAVMVIDPATAVSIIAQPVSRSVYAGGQFTFSVEAIGTLPVYQWRRDGTDLPGETSATISVVAGAGTVGTYTCRVSNGLGNVLSDPATAALRTPAAGSYEEAVVADAPRAFWRLNETSGALIKDSFGRHDGIASGFVSYGQPGVILGDTDTSLAFDGATTKIDVPYSAALNSESFTLECWANILYLPSTHASPVTCRDSSGNLQNGYMFYCTPNGASWDSWIGRAGYAGGWNILVGPAVAAAAWTHLAVTYNAVTSNQQFYVNGTLVASGTTTFGPNTTRPFRIGAGSTESAGDFWFPGSIDDVVYYPSALSADRITLHYGLAVYGPGQAPTIVQQPLPKTVYPGSTVSFSVVAGGTPPFNYQWKSNNVAIAGQTASTLVLTNVIAAQGATYSVTVANTYGNVTSAGALLTLRIPPADSYEETVAGLRPLAYWRLNEANGVLVAKDYAGGYDATHTATVVNGVEGPRAPLFPGLETGNTGARYNGTDTETTTGVSLMNNRSQFTILGWFKPTGDQVAANGRVGLFGQNDVAEFGYHGLGTIGIWTPGGGFASFSSSLVQTGKWHFITATGDGVNLTLYLNGKQVAQVAGATGNYGSSTAPFNFGYAVLDATGNYFLGDVDEVAFFDRALSLAEIFAINSKATGVELKISYSTEPYLVKDSKPSGTPHDGINRGAEWLASSADANTPPVTRSGVMNFTQTDNDQIVIPWNADFNTTQGAITFWIRSAGVTGPGSEGAMVIDRRTTTGDVIVQHTASGSIFWQPEGIYSQTGTAAVSDDKWHHVAYVFDQAAGASVLLYIDGVPDTTAPANSRAWSWGEQQIEIGRSHDGYWNVYNGQLDDIRFYRRLLSDVEVQQIYVGDATLVGAADLAGRYNFDAPPQGQKLILTWPMGALESADDLLGTWTPVTGATSPYEVLSPTGNKFFRLKL